MEDLQIGIEQDNGEYASYHLDAGVIDGLYITNNPRKVDLNCRTFKINIESPKPGFPITKMAKRENVVIITIKFDNENQFQYLVGPDLNLKQLKLMSSKLMPDEMKKMIKDAYELGQKKTFGDFL